MQPIFPKEFTGDGSHQGTETNAWGDKFNMNYALDLSFLLAFFSAKALIKFSRYSSLASSFSMAVIANSSNRSCRIVDLK